MTIGKYVLHPEQVLEWITSALVISATSLSSLFGNP
jgi:hypothetical protein